MTLDPLTKLEDESLRARVDPTGFHRLLEALPGQARDAWRLGQELPDRKSVV